MNILVISATYPEPDSFGVKRDTLAIHYFTRDWVSKGHNVLVIHPYYNGLGHLCDYFRIRRLNVQHSVIDNVNVVFGSSQILMPHALMPFPFQVNLLAKKIKKHIKKHFPHFVPDVVSVHFPFVLDSFVCSYCDEYSPKFAVFHGTDVRQLLSLNGIKKGGFAKKFNQLYRRYGFRSPKLLDSCCNNFLERSKSTVILSGLDDSLISSEFAIQRKINESNNNKLVLLFAGKLVKQKRIDNILRALSICENGMPFLLYIVGDGEELNSLKTLASTLKLEDKVVFTGGISRDNLSKKMYESDVFIMTSKNETLGLVYLEAMAQGCITIGSKGEGIEGVIINGENGFLCDPDNVVSISETIMNVYDLKKEKRNNVIRNAYNTVRSMTSDKMSELYLNELKQLANIKYV